jgi:hypothetical protein
MSTEKARERSVSVISTGVGGGKGVRETSRGCNRSARCQS